ncbi:hypothetical protein [Staphylospora marina]|uniref:hypothetical protein n=1 Tax=Staphylospora marina TaxID=2490858 RepID=UPI000F5BF875|nr:hypothetical protein [Staphylospora marina]
MKKHSLIMPFLSGAILLFVLIIAGSFLYATVGSMQGWPSVKLDLFGALIFHADIQAGGSFYVRLGQGLLLVALLGGFLNMGLAAWLRKKQTGA